MAKIKKVRSLFELDGTPELRKLACCAASNLGWDQRGGFKGAWRWLQLNAAETSDSDVVDEVNFCRDLVDTYTGPT